MSTQAGSLRTGPMMAVGVINLVLGILATLMGIAGFVFAMVLPDKLKELAAMRESLGAPADPHAVAVENQLQAMLAFAPAIALATALFGVLLMVSARGLLGMRPWARTLSLTLAWIMIARWVVLLPLALLGDGAFRVLDVGGTVYWVLLIVLLISREWKRAYAPPSESLEFDPLGTWPERPRAA